MEKTNINVGDDSVAKSPVLRTRRPRRPSENTITKQKSEKMTNLKLSEAIVIKPGDKQEDDSSSQKSNQLKLIVEDEDLPNSQSSLITFYEENEKTLMDFVIKKVKNNQDRAILQKRFGADKINTVESMIEEGCSKQTIYEELIHKAQDILANQSEYMKFMKKLNFNATPSESEHSQLTEEERIANLMKGDKKPLHKIRISLKKATVDNIPKKRSIEKTDSEETNNGRLEKSERTQSPVTTPAKQTKKKSTDQAELNNSNNIQNDQNDCVNKKLSFSSSESDAESISSSKTKTENLTVQNDSNCKINNAETTKNNKTSDSSDSSQDSDEDSVKTSNKAEEKNDINERADDSDKNENLSNSSEDEYNLSPKKPLKRSISCELMYSPKDHSKETSLDSKQSIMLSSRHLMHEETCSPQITKRKRLDELSDSDQEFVKNNENEEKYPSYLNDVKTTNTDELENNPTKNRINKKTVTNKIYSSSSSSDEELDHSSEIPPVKNKLAFIKETPNKISKVSLQKKAVPLIYKLGNQVSECKQKNFTPKRPENDPQEDWDVDPNQVVDIENESDEDRAIGLEYGINVLKECDYSPELFGIKDTTYDYTTLQNRILMRDAVRFHGILKERVKPLKEFIKTAQQDAIVKRFIQKLCHDEFLKGNCKNESCPHIHKLPNNWCYELKDERTWLIANTLFKECVNPSVSIFLDVLYWLGRKEKDSYKVLLISEYIMRNNCVSDDPNIWRIVKKALMSCGLNEWEAVAWLFIYHCKDNNAEKAKKLIFGTGMLKKAYSNFWPSVKPLTQLGFKLPVCIIRKLLEEVCAYYKNEAVLLIPRSTIADINDQVNSLSQEQASKLDSLIASFRKIHSHNFPVAAKGCLKKTKEAPNFKKITNNSLATDLYIPPFKHKTSTENAPKVMECDKISASLERALNVENVASIAQTIIKYSQLKQYRDFMIQKLIDLIPEEKAFSLTKAISHQISQDYDGKKAKEILARLCVTQMIKLAEQHQWKQAYDFLVLTRENHVNPIITKLVGYECSQVKVAIACSEINYYSKHYNSAIAVLINNNLLTKDSSKWKIEGTPADYKPIMKHISFLLKSLKCIDVVKALFTKILETQNDLSSPIDLADYYEPLLCNMLQKIDKYKDQIIPFYTQVNTIDSTLVLTGLTYRALLVLSKQMNQHKFCKEMVNKSIQTFVYCPLDKEINVVFINTCMELEEMEVYLIEWLRWYYINNMGGSPKNDLKIKFQISNTLDHVEDKDLIIPSLILSSDHNLSSAVLRINKILEKLAGTLKDKVNLKMKSETLIIPPATFKVLIKAARKAY